MLDKQGVYGGKLEDDKFGIAAGASLLPSATERCADTFDLVSRNTSSPATPTTMAITTASSANSAASAWITETSVIRIGRMAWLSVATRHFAAATAVPQFTIRR